MAAPETVRGRLAELLAAEATGLMDGDEQAELERLLRQTPDADRDDFVQVAGLAQVALFRQDARAGNAMPPALRARLTREARAWQAGRQASTAAPVADLQAARERRERRAGPAPAGPNTRLANLGWYLAAALAVVFLVVEVTTPGSAPPQATAEMRRELLTREAPDAVRLAWAASSAPGFERATGDVVWSSARQEGYLSLAGLPANDPQREQYQLWIVDPERDSRPVDGGVFDVGASGRAVVPIHAKLPVSRATAFAITREKPGGVVVSDGPMLLVAAIGG